MATKVYTLWIRIGLILIRIKSYDNIHKHKNEIGEQVWAYVNGLGTL